MSEQLKFQARLAGAEVKDKPSKHKKKANDDEYGKILEHRKKMKDAAIQFSDLDLSGCTHPL